MTMQKSNYFKKIIHVNPSIKDNILRGGLNKREWWCFEYTFKRASVLTAYMVSGSGKHTCVPPIQEFSAIEVHHDPLQSYVTNLTNVVPNLGIDRIGCRKCFSSLLTPLVAVTTPTSLAAYPCRGSRWFVQLRLGKEHQTSDIGRKTSDVRH